MRTRVDAGLRAGVFFSERDSAATVFARQLGADDIPNYGKYERRDEIAPETTLLTSIGTNLTLTFARARVVQTPGRRRPPNKKTGR